MAIATLAEYRTATGAKESNEQIQFMLDATEETIKQELGSWLLTPATFTEFYLGTGRELLVLRHRPVTSIASVHVDESAYYGFASGAFGSSTLLTAGVDYALDITSAGYSRSGMVRRIGNVWNASARVDRQLATVAVDAPGNIKVVYTAGMPSITADLKLAHIQLTSGLMNTIEIGGPIQSESLDYYSYTMASNAEAMQALTSAKRILSRYKEIVF